MYNRIDLWARPDGRVTVTKFEDQYTLDGYIPRDTSIQEAWSLDQMAAWLEGKGWTVRRWPGGARAFKDGLKPIRTRAQIHRKRDVLKLNPPKGVEVHALDLAYDF